VSLHLDLVLFFSLCGVRLVLYSGTRRRTLVALGSTTRRGGHSFPKGDTFLNYLYTLCHKQHLILNLINPHIGAAEVEGDAPTGLQQGTRQISSGRKKRQVEDPAFDALVLHSSKMAAAAKNHADSSKLSSLSATLKNLKDAGADPELIHSMEVRL